MCKKISSRNNIWNKKDFLMCGLGKKSKLIAVIKHIIKCIKWSKQRIIRGYAECDKWDMCDYLQVLIPTMLQDMKEKRTGSLAYLGKDYTNENGVVVNDECHKEWDEILERMIFLWRESLEDTCTRKNPYEEEYWKAQDEFEKMYGQFGEKLQTEREREEKRKSGKMRVHFMDELPMYKDISDKYFAEERAIEDYRVNCKDEAMDLLKEHFFALWD